jgi:ClpP class serine protease
LGVSVDEISFSKSFDLTSLDKEMTPEAWKRFQYRTDHVYSVFLNRVAEGRQLNLEFLKDNVAGGRVWSGDDALKIGLIDEFGNESCRDSLGIGGLLKSIKVAGLTGWKKKINAKKDTLVEDPDLINVVIYPKHKSILERLLDRTGGSVLERVKMEMKGMLKNLILDMIQEEQAKMEQGFYSSFFLGLKNH